MNKVIIDEQSEHIDDEDINVLFKDSIAFSQFIERKSISDNLSRMQAILQFCEQRLLDIDDVTHLISLPLKEKLKVEMVESNMIKVEDTNSLDIFDE